MTDNYYIKSLFYTMKFLLFKKEARGLTKKLRFLG